jgi:predicted DNA-binding ribbon-helix-helix protein
MRTTVRLNENLLQEAKKFAAETNRTLTRLIEDALREALARRRSSNKRQTVRLTTVKGRGPYPGVDLNCSAALLEVMERDVSS